MAWTMWKRISARRTTPAIQWIVTQGNRIPTTGKNAVIRSTNIETAMSQWKPREAGEWRSTRSGTPGAGDAGAGSGWATIFT